MGIKDFFPWFREKFSKEITQLKRHERMSVPIDTLLIDMNGLFHTAAQKVYRYGEYKPKSLLLPVEETPLKNPVHVYREVCNEIERLVAIAQPQKQLILCVDGPAPISKQDQQRQRRFSSAKNMEKFDSNCMTPGTVFMDRLTKYIDWFIRKKISSDEYGTWKNLQVVFSNEKVPGEGEHKLMTFVRKYGNRETSYCLCGMDADLIMLGLSAHYPKFWILRENPRDYHHPFYLIDVGSVHSSMGREFDWGGTYNETNAVNDFILMCFTVGNDFLPHIQGLEIVEGAIDFMIETYRKVGREYGHLTQITQTGSVFFSTKAMAVFFKTIGMKEKEVLEQKLAHKDKFFPDILLEQCATKTAKWELDINKYKNSFYKTKLPEIANLSELSREYLNGMQWVLSYYTTGVPSWNWRYSHHYAPFASTLGEYIEEYTFKRFESSKPSLPFVQLISVLPPKSANLLPLALQPLLLSQQSELKPFIPDDFVIDLSGKRKEWQGIVIIPMMDGELANRVYRVLEAGIDANDLKRNVRGKSFVYSRSQTPTLFKSYYGEFTAYVSTAIINL
jgi:5'-3' exoribonuclease 1